MGPKSFCILLLGMLICSPLKVTGQNFSKEYKHKTLSAQLSLGAGTSLPAPRPYSDSILASLRPVFSFGVEKRIASNLSLKSQASLQAFTNSEYSKSTQITASLDQGISYAFEITPTFNLIPTYNHLYRPKVDFNLGIGLGYLATYRAEKFTFQGKEYTFNFLEHSPFVPLRTALSFRLDDRSDLGIEGVFFRTWLEKSNTDTNFKLNGNHFAQMNLIYRRFIR